MPISISGIRGTCRARNGLHSSWIQNMHLSLWNGLSSPWTYILWYWKYFSRFLQFYHKTKFVSVQFWNINLILNIYLMHSEHHAISLYYFKLQSSADSKNTVVCLQFMFIFKVIWFLSHKSILTQFSLWPDKISCARRVSKSRLWKLTFKLFLLLFMRRDDGCGICPPVSFLYD